MVSLDISVSVSLVSVGPSILLCNQIVREGFTPFDYMLYHSHSFLNFASIQIGPNQMNHLCQA